uniref:Uncharacterized protein n=1 Tax=Plectus sambesii TaxID=2011161 RepID=A0A914VVU4_9BILA
MGSTRTEAARWRALVDGDGGGGGAAARCRMDRRGMGNRLWFRKSTRTTRTGCGSVRCLRLASGRTRSAGRGNDLTVAGGHQRFAPSAPRRCHRKYSRCADKVAFIR